MHKEEFFFTLIEDEFISWLLSQIEKIAKEYKIDEIIELINNLENDCHNDMISIFGNALDEIKKYEAIKCNCLLTAEVLARFHEYLCF